MPSMPGTPIKRGIVGKCPPGPTARGEGGHIYLIAGISLLIISCHKIIQYRYCLCSCRFSAELSLWWWLAVSENYICGGEPAVSKDE